MLTRPQPIQLNEYQSRIQRARELLELNKSDALIVNAGTSLRYFAGISWGATERFVAMVLPVDKAPFFICPAFEEGSLRAELVHTDLELLTWDEEQDPYSLCGRALTDLKLSNIALDPGLSFGAANKLQHNCPDIRFVDGANIIDGCRRCKSDAEISILQYAKNLTMEVHRRTHKVLELGMSTEEVRHFIDQTHRQLGASGSSFCIALFGEATSYPHGVPGEQRLKDGDVVLIDTGCTIMGYHSDITRTYVFGSPTQQQRDVWDLEKAAQQAAFDAAQLGTPCEAADAAARTVLEQAGMGPDYKLPGLPHRTGHGIGLSIHEAPYLVRGETTLLQKGMCFSNEPMIVVPGSFGIRLEDHFFMGENGPVWFTRPATSIDTPV